MRQNIIMIHELYGICETLHLHNNNIPTLEHFDTACEVVGRPTDNAGFCATRHAVMLEYYCYVDVVSRIYHIAHVSLLCFVTLNSKLPMRV